MKNKEIENPKRTIELQKKVQQVKRGLIYALDAYLSNRNGEDKMSKQHFADLCMESVDCYASWHVNNMSDKDIENREVISELVDKIRKDQIPIHVGK